MSPLSRLVLAACLSLPLLAAPRVAGAQAPSKPVVVVNVAPGDTELDPASLRAAIGAELGDDAVAADDPRAAEAVGTIRVSVDHRAHALVVAYTGLTEPITRTVDLPADRATTERTAVLLAGNLARDEGDELASSLHKPKPSTKKAPPAADPEAMRELDVLGETLALREQESRARRTVSTVTFLTGLTGLVAGTGILFASIPKGDDSMAATGEYVAAAGGGVMAVGAFLRPGNFKDLHAQYLSWREYISPGVARDDLEQEWDTAAREERTRRVTQGIWAAVGGGVEIATGIAQIVQTEMQPNATANSVGPWVAVTAMGAEITALGIYLMATDGPVASALHDYQRSTGRVVRLPAADAGLSLRPFLAPARGGGMAGIGGQF